ncbi:MAG TPA: radical SAM protein [Thermodesulfobacteriota bacterium]|nr:radical SAM protein [Thermodesulfobacteriota bacterium]
MKILLIQPPIRDFYQTSIRTQPIGLAYLAASLRTHGYEVEILDCQTRGKKSVAIPSDLSYLRDFYPFNDRSPFKLYSGFYHFGMGWDDIQRKVETSKADVFGISSSFTPYHEEALEIARIIKDWDQRKIVVMGGPHVSGDPADVLKSPCVDYVVLGEGEIRFPALLEKIEKDGFERMKEIDGIGCREDGEIRINPLQSFIQDLDILPCPARDLLDLDRYRIKKKRFTMLITSRGCPHGCAYCSAHLVMGNAFRRRSAEAIVKEMKDCRERFGIQVFDIEDDNFTFDRERAKNLMKQIIETFGERNLELSAMNGVSFASMDAELLRLMKRAGFETINLSFVSTDILTKERMRRPRAKIEFDQILEDADKIGLHVIAYGIFGMPGQTIEEMADTLIYLMGKKVLIGPSIYYPTPGTPLFEKCRTEGLLPSHPSLWRSSAFPIETKEFSRLDLVTFFRLARIINFVKGKMDGGELKEGMTWRELSQFTKEKVKDNVKVQINQNTPCALGSAPCDITWKDLLRLVIRERSFFGLRKNSHGKLMVTKEKSSKKVLDYFFEKASDQPILKTCSP